MKTRRSFLFVIFGVLLGVLQIPWRKTTQTVRGFHRTNGLESSWPTIPALPEWCFKSEWLTFVCDRLVTDWETCSSMYRTLPHKLQIRKSCSPFSDRPRFELAISHQIYLSRTWHTEVCDLNNVSSRSRAIVTVGAMFRHHRELRKPSSYALHVLQCLSELLTFLREYDELQKIGPGSLKEVPVGTTV